LGGSQASDLWPKNSKTSKHIVLRARNSKIGGEFRFSSFEFLPRLLQLVLSGVKKPEEAIHRLALQMTQCPPAEFGFIDDRAVNLECARQLGVHTIQFQSAAQLANDLRTLGVVMEG
jgi:HAD superfamily hydrolase (TIGR01509 family)